MAANMKEIKERIDSVKNTSQITNAMQMVSAAKLGKSEQAAKDFQIYASKVPSIFKESSGQKVCLYCHHF